MSPDEPTARETWSEWLFGAPQVDYAGGVIAILSGVASIVGYIYTAIYHPSDTTAALVAVGILSFILCAGIAILAMAHSQKTRKLRRQAVAIERLRAGTVAAQKDYIVAAENLNTILAEFATRLYETGRQRTPHLGQFVNCVRNIFDRLSDSGQAAVCIKLLKYEHSRTEFDGPYVWTVKRDDTSVLRRGRTDERPSLKRYAPDDNKAFSDIMARNIGKDYFFCNDLKSMSGYFNSNPHWRDFYNAAVVVPIKPCKADVLKSAIGFLCVDSLHGRFNEEVTVTVLILLAEILYHHLKGLSDALVEPPD